MLPRERRRNRNRDQNENLLNDIAQPEQTRATLPDKRHYIKFLPRIYWFFYRKPTNFLIFIPKIISGIISSYSYFSVAFILDSIHKENGLQLIKKYALINFGIALTKGFLSLVEKMSWTYFIDTLRIKMKREVFKAILKKDVEFFDEKTYGDISTILNEDVGRAMNLFTRGKISQIQTIASIVSSFLICIALDWRISLFSITSVFLTNVFTRMLRDNGRKYFKAGKESMSQIVTISEETISNMRTVMSFNRQQTEQERYAEQCNKNCACQSNSSLIFHIAGRFSFLMDQGAQCVCLNIGSYMILKGQLTPGILFLINRESFSLGHKIMGFISQIQNEQQWLESADRIFELIDYAPSVPYDSGAQIDNFKGRIEFREVWFKYPTRNVWVLKNISFEIPEGDIAAFVGHSGSGKSTIVQLLLRFYDVSSGQILLGGVDIRELDPRWIHKVMSVVQQEPSLFSLTIRQNVTYGLEYDISEDEIDKVIEISQSSNFVSKLPQKKETLVGEKGAKLSGGQKQRIGIARAVIRNPTILITDEATSALDSTNEKKVQIALEKIMKGRTSIIIAHRLGTIKSAKTIFVFDAGEIVEFGTHDELINKKGAFFNLVKRQL